MGGKALKIETERKTTDEFNKIASVIIPIIENKLGVNTFIAKCFHNKDTHGDMDILIEITHEFYNKGINIVEFIKTTFNPTDINSNNSVVSFDYDNFQIDIITISESNWDIAKVWYSYDPIANLLGKTAHKFNTKHGTHGLTMPFRNFNGRQSHNITLSKDPNEIFSFLGYDYNEFLNGFDNLEDTFNYVINGRYFDHTTFLYENLRHIDRKRNAKRSSYNKFLEFINNNDIKTTYRFKPKEEYLNDIADFFPEANLLEKIEVLRKKDNQNQTLATKFNGKLVMANYPNLKSKMLGDAMLKFKENLGEWKDMFMEMTTDEIMDEFDVYILNTK